MKRAGIQTAIRLLYPPRCGLCETLVDSEFGLCGPCWRDTPFITGLVCEACGVPLPGQGKREYCDSCLSSARPWRRGRAALLYKANGRRLVLSLKHGDRHDLIRPAAGWLARAAAPLLVPDMIIAPIPLHWMRLYRRRYNQAALLARGIVAQTGHSLCPDLLQRPKRTRMLDGLGHTARFDTLKDAIRLHPKRQSLIAGKPVLLVDDVMTSGATFTAAAHACLDAGAGTVCILALARVGFEA